MGKHREEYNLRNRIKILFGENAKLNHKTNCGKHYLIVINSGLDKDPIISEECDSTSDAFKSASRLLKIRYEQIKLQND